MVKPLPLRDAEVGVGSTSVLDASLIRTTSELGGQVVTAEMANGGVRVCVRTSMREFVWSGHVLDTFGDFSFEQFEL